MPRIKLRELIKKSSQALLDMKPCFIMSPTVLSELVVAQEDFFDLLIIDEALTDENGRLHMCTC